MKIRTRLYIETELEIGGVINIIAPQLHFLKNVMRIKEGEYISLFNGKDGEFIAEIVEVKNKFILAKCVEQSREQTSTSNIKLYFGSTNKHRLAFLVEKATELGVSELQPVLTEYGDVKQFKIDKMALQVVEAAEQSERLDVPKVHDVIKLADIEDNSDVILFADESRVGQSLVGILPQLKDKSISIIVGPAGGFSVKEKEFVNSLANVQNISLGGNILRVETAAVMILSCLQSV